MSVFNTSAFTARLDPEETIDIPSSSYAGWIEGLSER